MGTLVLNLFPLHMHLIMPFLHCWSYTSTLVGSTTITHQTFLHTLLCVLRKTFKLTTYVSRCSRTDKQKHSSLHTWMMRSYSMWMRIGAVQDAIASFPHQITHILMMTVLLVYRFLQFSSHKLLTTYINNTAIIIHCLTVHSKSAILFTKSKTLGWVPVLDFFPFFVSTFEPRCGLINWRHLNNRDKG